MNQNEHPDYVALTRLMQEAKPLLAPMFPDQLKNWAADSPLAQEISTILAKHPEYYEEVHAHMGAIFPKPKS
jgi:hypothetical protein